MEKPNLRNNRYAFEWFVREQDEKYWNMAKTLISEKSKREKSFFEKDFANSQSFWGKLIITRIAEARNSIIERQRKMTVLIIASTVATLILARIIKNF